MASGSRRPVLDNRNRRAARYGLTWAQVAAMYDRQDGLCKLCLAPTALEGDGCVHIDHDHATGRVRGLLCPTCNRRVGYYEVALEDTRLMAYVHGGFDELHDNRNDEPDDDQPTIERPTWLRSR